MATTSMETMISTETKAMDVMVTFLVLMVHQAINMLPHLMVIHLVTVITNLMLVHLLALPTIKIHLNNRNCPLTQVILKKPF